MLAGEYKGYTRTVDAGQVAALFERRYGYRPSEIHDGGTIWLAGPIRNGRGLLARVEAARVEAAPVEAAPAQIPATAVRSTRRAVATMSTTVPIHSTTTARKGIAAISF